MPGRPSQVWSRPSREEVLNVSAAIQIRNRRILVVDDRVEIQEDFRRILMASESQDQGQDELEELKDELFGDLDDAPPVHSDKEPKVDFEMETAIQGEEGGRLVKEARESGNPFGVAFVDMRMPPGWDGVYTIQKMWEDDPELEIAICTAYTDYTQDEISERL